MYTETRAFCGYVAAARAFVLVPDVRRCETPRDVVAVAVGDADVALRAVAVVVDARRGTTPRFVVLTGPLVRVRTFMCAFDCDGLVPGFKFVRMVLFMYGYRLLYVFALT